MLNFSHLSINSCAGPNVILLYCIAEWCISVSSLLACLAARDHHHLTHCYTISLHEQKRTGLIQPNSVSRTEVCLPPSHPAFLCSIVCHPVKHLGSLFYLLFLFHQKFSLLSDISKNARKEGNCLPKHPLSSFLLQLAFN